MSKKSRKQSDFNEEAIMLKNLLDTQMELGNYQFILEKSCEIGHESYVSQVVKIAREIGLPTLSIFEALKIAASYGHLEIVQNLIKRDIENERYHDQTPNILWSFLYDYTIPYTNDPLTTEQLREIISEAKNGNHTFVVDEIEKYYKRMYQYKRASEINRARLEQ